MCIVALRGTDDRRKRRGFFRPSYHRNFAVGVRTEIGLFILSTNRYFIMAYSPLRLGFIIFRVFWHNSHALGTLCSSTILLFRNFCACKCAVAGALLMSARLLAQKSRFSTVYATRFVNASAFLGPTMLWCVMRDERI